MSCENGSAAECLASATRRTAGEPRDADHRRGRAGGGGRGDDVGWTARRRSTPRPSGAADRGVRCTDVRCRVGRGDHRCGVGGGQPDRPCVGVGDRAGLPAFLAGATVARLLAVVRIVHASTSPGTKVLRGAGEPPMIHGSGAREQPRWRLAATGDGQGGGARALRRCRLGDRAPGGAGAGRASDRGRRGGRCWSGGSSRADARHRPLAGPQRGALRRDRGVRRGAAVVGGAHERPVRAVAARRRGGGGLRAAHRLGAARRAGPGTSASPPDGLDPRPARPDPRGRGRDHGGDRVPARVGRRAGHRPQGRGVAARPGAEGGGRDRVAGVAARRDLATPDGGGCRGCCWPGCGSWGVSTAACRAGPRPPVPGTIRQ